jgi:hypothetical protein
MFLSYYLTHTFIILLLSAGASSGVLNRIGFANKEVFTCDDDIFAPTEFEIFGTHGPWYQGTPWCNRNAEVGPGQTPPGTANPVNQADFEYYREYYNANDPALGWPRWKKYGAPGTGGGTNWEDDWWLAGPSRYGGTHFCCADVLSDYGGRGGHASNVFGVSPAFAVR